MNPIETIQSFQIRQVAIENSEFAEYVHLMRDVQDAAFASFVDVPGGLTPYQLVLMTLSVNAFNTYSAVTDLLEGGFSRPALALHRGLFEQMLQAYWLAGNPKTGVERYRQIDVLHRWYHFQNIERWGTALPDPSLKAGIVEELCLLVENYGLMGTGDQLSKDREACKAEPDSWARLLKNRIFGGGPIGKWHGLSVKAMVDEIGPAFPHWTEPFSDGTDHLQYLHRVVYAISSDFVHASHRATAIAVSKNVDGLELEIGPNPSDTPRVFSTAVSFLTWILFLMEKEFPTGIEARMDSIYREHPAIIRSSAAF